LLVDFSLKTFVVLPRHPFLLLWILYNMSMEIYAHRGIWGKKSEQNTFSGIQKAFSEGFGVETDIRYRDGKLVIGHDVDSNFLDFESLIEIWVLSGRLPMALNVKEDGLAPVLTDILRESGFNKTEGCFLFDMSIPEEVVYEKLELCVAKRVSELEPISRFIEAPEYIWLDSFHNIWWQDIWETLSECPSRVVIVSEELHGRSHLNLIEMAISDFAFGICTDFPGDWRGKNGD